MTAPRMLRFALVGGASTLLDFSAFGALVYLFGMYPVAAHMCSYGLAIVFSYLLNRQWTFQAAAPRRSRGIEFLRFLSVQLAGAMLGALVIYLLEDAITAIGAKVSATLVTFLWNYFGNSLLVFNAPAPGR